MKPAVLVATKGWDPEHWADRIRPLLPDRKILCTDRGGVYAGQDDELADIEYVLAWKPLLELFDRLPKLRVIFSLGAGVDHIFTLPRIPDVPIVRIVDDDLTGRMVEYVVWQVLHQLRRGFAYSQRQAEHRWDALDQPASHQVTVGIMGLGVMGSSAAEALLRLGFQVRGWSRSPRTMTGMEVFTGPEAFDRFLSGTDILVALLPLTPETTRLIDMECLRKLRRDGQLGGPILINAGRGGSQVEADIATAIREGTLAGASLDVFETEPLPADSPLWDLPNVVITPHVAAVSDPQPLARQIADQIVAFERGENLRNVVDRSRGY